MLNIKKDGPTAAPSPLVARAAEVEVLADGPTSLISLLADADATNGALTVNRATLHVGSPGAPPHFHTRVSEGFFVLEGSLDVLAGEDILTLNKGDFLLVPPHLPHAFGPTPGHAADALVIFAPGLLRFDYYRLLERVDKGEASPEEIGESSEQFDNHYFDSPIWRQARQRN